MSTVACGLYLGHRSSAYLSIDARLQASAFWNTFTFVLNGLVFILIGLQLPYILAGIRALALGRLLGLGLFFSAIVIALRLLWMFPGAWVSNQIDRRLLHRKQHFPDPRYVFIVGWTGMRGVLALAAAIALPEFLESGAPFPQRNLIIYFTFSVIFVTLVLQGLTLPAVIRRLGLSGFFGEDPEEREARRIIAQASLQFLQNARSEDSSGGTSVYDELIRVQRRRLSMLAPESHTDENSPLSDFDRFHSVAQEMRTVQRAALLRLHAENKVNDEVLRRLEHELDILEARFPASGHL